MSAVCIFFGLTISGKLFLTEHNDGLLIKGSLDGIPIGMHGISLHESGEVSHDCRQVGGHFNPDGTHHGPAGREDSHAGDLGNLNVREPGPFHVNIHTKSLTLQGAHSAMDHTIAIHERPDDGMPGGKEDGNEGRAIGCCKVHVEEMGPGIEIPHKH